MLAQASAQAKQKASGSVEVVDDAGTAGSATIGAAGGGGGGGVGDTGAEQKDDDNKEEEKEEEETKQEQLTGEEGDTDAAGGGAAADNAAADNAGNGEGGQEKEEDDDDDNEGAVDHAVEEASHALQVELEEFINRPALEVEFPDAASEAAVAAANAGEDNTEVRACVCDFSVLGLLFHRLISPPILAYPSTRNAVKLNYARTHAHTHTHTRTGDHLLEPERSVLSRVYCGWRARGRRHGAHRPSSAVDLRRRQKGVLS